MQETFIFYDLRDHRIQFVNFMEVGNPNEIMYFSSDPQHGFVTEKGWDFLAILKFITKYSLEFAPETTTVLDKGSKNQVEAQIYDSHLKYSIKISADNNGNALSKLIKRLLQLHRIVSPSMAKKLNEANFPAPEVGDGQLWYDTHLHFPILIRKIDGILYECEVQNEDNLKELDKDDLAAFAPTIEDIKERLPKTELEPRQNPFINDGQNLDDPDEYARIWLRQNEKTQNG